MRTLTIVFALLAAAGIAAGEETIGYSILTLDTSAGIVDAYAATEPDYSTGFYYQTYIYAWLISPSISRSGSDFRDGETAFCWFVEPLTPEETYELYGDHTLVITYYVYEVEPYCSFNCYDWYDPFGYHIYDDGCRLENGEPCEPDPPFIYSITKWLAPLAAYFLAYETQELGRTEDTETAPPAVLTCSPSTILRGQSTTCTVSGVHSSRVGAWTFSGGGATVPGPSGQLSWSGTVVAGGTVTVSIVGHGAKQAQIAVTSRSGWATGSVSPTSGTLCTFTSPPTGGPLGCSTYAGSYSPSSLTGVTSGPNTGFAYYSSNFVITQSFPWHIHPDVNNLQSDFASHQYGRCGIISASNLKTNVTRHESSSTPRSHYAQYSASLQTNDPGTYLEARVATPQTDKNAFHNESRGQVATKLNSVYTDAGNETNLFGPNQDQSTGESLGLINYPSPSYAPCP